MLLNWFLIGLATWRLYRMVALNTGPKCVFRRFRVWVGVRYTVDGWETDDGSLAEMLTCSECFPVWASIALTAIWLFAPYNVFLLITVPLSASAFVLFYENHIYARLEEK